MSLINIEHDEERHMLNEMNDNLFLEEGENIQLL